MFVDKITTDSKNFVVGAEPSWDRVEQALLSLDSNTMTEVCLLKKGAEARMSIMGGGEYFLVAATLDNDVYYDLMDSDAEATSDKLTLVTGRQTVHVNRVDAVRREKALKVAQLFFREGAIDPTERWRRSPPT